MGVVSLAVVSMTVISILGVVGCPPNSGTLRAFEQLVEGRSFGPTLPRYSAAWSASIRASTTRFSGLSTYLASSRSVDSPVARFLKENPCIDPPSVLFSP